MCLCQPNLFFYDADANYSQCWDSQLTNETFADGVTGYLQIAAPPVVPHIPKVTVFRLSLNCCKVEADK